ncbi:MAG: hypothetical protein FJ271_25265 [Planctomycetes bacterium]|nr:hypothetical protein [Planctomycetota bacterium]
MGTTLAERIPRPKARRLTDKESSTILAALTKAIAASPVLSYLGVQVRVQRGRFYLERKCHQDDDDSEVEVLGRVTPLAAAKQALLLETENRSGSWSEESKGTVQKVIKAVASDTEGTFHGLGSIDTVLRKSGKGLTRLPVKKVGKNKFVYSETGAICSVQEALFHYFGLPLEVIAEPSEWYSYHREPEIVESGKDKKRVLVRFSAVGPFGEFGGSCLYAERDGSWDAYTLRPSESRNIATAEAWLVKRKWEAW